MTRSYRERPSIFAGATSWQVDPVGPNRVLPDGCMDLIWMDDRMVVAGPDTTAHLSVGGRAHGIRFAPGTLPALLGVPARVLLDQRVGLEELVPVPLVRSLAEQLSGSADPSSALERAVLQSIGAPPVSAFASAVLDGLERDRSVSDLAVELGFGERQLLRRCRDAFGYGPARLRRILRLQRVLELSATRRSLASIAADAGFADQPHLHRDVVELTGLTPTALLAERAGFS